MTQPKTPPRIHVLAKPTGAICNLNCSYCFFLDKEQLYPGSKFRMADEVLETYIRQLIETHRTKEVTVAWQGGEPTLSRRNADLILREEPGIKVVPLHQAEVLIQYDAADSKMAKQD